MKVDYTQGLVVVLYHVDMTPLVNIPAYCEQNKSTRCDIHNSSDDIDLQPTVDALLERERWETNGCRNYVTLHLLMFYTL